MDTPLEKGARRRGVVVTTLGFTQILAWGSSYYLLAVLAKPIAADTGWPLAWVVGGVSLGLLVAGLASPRVGDAIERRGGRPVLAASAVLQALGLLGLGLAPSLPAYLACWVVLGLGMGAGLYDAAFATLGRLYGQRARISIATLTLFGRFASTVCWPLSAAFVSEFGWRGACLTYATVHLALVLPLYILVLPQETDRNSNPLATQLHVSRHERLHASTRSNSLLVLLAAAITVNSVISTVVSVHLLTILQARDIAVAAAVALGALVGPSQVGARAIEMAVSRYHHPVWTLLASTVLIVAGVGMLCLGWAIVSLALMFYGAGIGLESIARGTLPLAMFGEKGYAAIMGRIAMPSLIAQAASPSLGALLIQWIGASGTLAVLSVTAVADMLLAMALFGLLLRQRAADPSKAATAF